MKKVQTYLIILFFCFSPDLYAQVPDWEWARSANTNRYELAWDVVTYPVTNDVYVVGEWSTNLSASFPAGANPSTNFISTYGVMNGFAFKYNYNHRIDNANLYK